jgi:hypothetical protein
MNAAPLLRHQWLLFLAVNVWNAISLHKKSRPIIEARPELADGYRTLVRGMVFWGGLPWVVMGVGLELGGVPSPFSYFRPQDGNPFVLALIGVAVAEWLIGFDWIFRRGGAEFLFEHPGLLQGGPESPAAIRRGYCLIVAAGVAGLCSMYLMDAPLAPR